jgi:SpoVK/Ycf46/Vps4 family AAA+-type ATPase
VVAGQDEHVDDRRARREKRPASQSSHPSGTQRPFEREHPADRPLHVANLKPLPRGRDDLPLLRVVQPEYTFDDLVLGPEVRATLAGVVAELRERERIRAYGIRPRSRLLFVGPPGCGKSATAQAMAYELGFPIAKVHLATVVSSYLGETARNIDGIFQFCAQGTWVLLFDEFDSLAKERADRGEHGELKRVVTAFLQLLDEFSSDSPVIATTNHPALLDEAVWRRFDDVLLFPPPTPAEISLLIAKKLRAIAHDPIPARLSAAMKGLTQADIENVCYSGIRLALLDGRATVLVRDLEAGLMRMEERQRAIRTVRSPNNRPSD